MSRLRSKIAQLFILGFDGIRLEDNAAITRFLKEYGVGGVVLFDKQADNRDNIKNIQSIDQIRELNHSIREYCRNACGRVPLICLDYEGGQVDRLANVTGIAKQPSALTMAAMDNDEYENTVRDMARTLNPLGFNTNFAPVVDLGLSADRGIIAPLQRSFGTDPERVSQLAEKFVRYMAEYNIATCFKHFPGHGSACDDSHTGFVDATENFNEEELKPYQLLKKIQHLPVTVMTAHLINRRLDASGLPATLSPSIIGGLLRQEISFDGVVISDDLQMQAISKKYAIVDAIIMAINAGCDMLIIANQLGQEEPEQLLDAIETAVLSGKIEEGRLDEALARIQRLQANLIGNASVIKSDLYV